MADIEKTIFLASAGTGKTYQVTHLYIALLLGDGFPDAKNKVAPKFSIVPKGITVPSDRILMLTFAKNAAAEMRTRITRAIEEKITASAPGDDEEYWRILRNLDSADIATIHAFGNRLLKQHALALGLAPRFEVMDAAQQKEMLQGAILSCLSETLQLPSSVMGRALAVLCEGRGTGFLLEEVVNFFAQCRCEGVDASALDPDQCLAVPTPPTAADLKDIYQQLVSIIGTEETSDDLDDFMLKFKHTVSTLQGPEPVEKIIELALELCNVAGQMGVNKKKGKAITKVVREYAKSALKRLADYFKYADARELAGQLLEFIADCAATYEQRKGDTGQLDYDDLLVKVRDLVAQDDAGEDEAGALPPYEVVIVDEAQDNSRVQNEIIRAICDATGAQLILCGDPKQTIHAWRGADQRGMKALADDFGLTERPLQTSYRSQQGVVGWVNRIFAVVFGEDDYTGQDKLQANKKAKKTKGPNIELLVPDWEFNYRDNPGNLQEQLGLAPTKKTDLPQKRLQVKPSQVKKVAENPEEYTGTVPHEQWRAWYEEQYGRKQTLEARAVARRVKLLCSPGANPPWKPEWSWDSEDETWVKTGAAAYHYRDILILLRATTRQHLYEAALQELGIPYTTGGKGKGFWFRQEVKDIANLLSWLAYPYDDAALLAVARSPFIGLSDTAISLLARGEEGGLRSYFLRYTLAGRGSDREASAAALVKAGLLDDAASYRRGVALLEQLRRHAGRLGVTALLRQAIALTGYDAVCAGGFNRSQKLANLNKLLARIEQQEHRDSLDLQAVARWLNKEIEEQTTEADATVLDPNDDAVRIMSIHASKGLTSPVVIIPDLRRKEKADSSWLHFRCQDGNAVAARLKAYDDSLYAWSPHVSPTAAVMTRVEYETADFAAAKENKRVVTSRELKNLFYVAATRARDLVIFSGENPAGSSCWRNDINMDLLKSGQSSDALVRVVNYDKVLTAFAQLPELPDTGRTGEITALELTAAAAGLPALPEEEVYRMTATRIAAIPTDNDAKQDGYLRTRLVGLAPTYFSKPSEDEPEDAGLDERDDDAWGLAEQREMLRQHGTLGHEILENIDWNGDTATQADELISKLGLPAEQDKMMRQQMEQVIAVLEPELKGLPPENIIRELPFAAKFEHDDATVYVDGAIDMLYFKDGTWHIVDYKFSDAVEEQLIKKYGLQLAIYRAAITASAKGQKRVPLFVSDGEPVPFSLALLGVSKKGRVTRVLVPETDTVNVSASVVAAARTIESLCNPEGEV